jgi:hypothetical protein
MTKVKKYKGLCPLFDNNSKYGLYGGFYLSANSDQNFYIWNLYKSDNISIKLVKNYTGFVSLVMSVVKGGFIYLCFSTAIEKRNLDFSLVWTYTYPGPASPFSIVVDDDGSIYATGTTGTTGTTGDVRKIDSNGSLVWSQTHGYIGRGIEIYGDFIYKSGDRPFAGSVSVYKLNKSNGSLVWGIGPTSARIIRTDSFGNSYNSDVDNRIYKRRASDGLLLLTLQSQVFFSFNIINDVIYASTLTTLYRYDLNFNLLESVLASNTLTGFIMYDGLIYAINRGTGSGFQNSMFKFEPNNLTTLKNLGLLGNPRAVDYLNKNDTLQITYL